MGVHTREQKVYLQVISDGTIRKQVPEGTEGAVRREYEDRDTKEVKYKTELVYNAIDGKLGDITLQKGKFGDQLMVPITDVETGETLTLALGTSSNFGEDFMKKLPNVDMSKPVILSPFSFVSDQGKDIRGIDVRQDFDVNTPGSGTKIKNYYRDEEAKKNINGLPDPEGDTKSFSSDDWKVYFINVRKFLVNSLKEKGIIKDAAVAAANKPVNVVETEEAPDLTTESEQESF